MTRSAVKRSILAAADVEDLEILSARLQDGLARLKDLVWMPRQRRFTALFNRFLWESGRPQRTRAVLSVDSVLKVQSQNIKLGAGKPGAGEAVVSLLAIRFTPPGEAENPGGEIALQFSGGGAIRLEVECIDAALADLGRPWPARRPEHEA
jgi:hypothetical protein